MEICRDSLGDGTYGPEMVKLPASTFMMGSPPDEQGRDKDEGPQQWIAIHHFAIGRYEVTIAEFELFVKQTGYKEVEDGDCFITFDTKDWSESKEQNYQWRKPGFSQTSSNPVTCVSWKDAVAYARWLSVKTEKHYRLPTEAEWEYAARAGVNEAYFWKDDVQCRYANGLDASVRITRGFPESGVFADCTDGYVYTAPVGSFKPNAFGLYDTAGNVREWVQDCYHDRLSFDQSGSEAWEKENCTWRVTRGGSWNKDSRFL